MSTPIKVTCHCGRKMVKAHVSRFGFDEGAIWHCVGCGKEEVDCDCQKAVVGFTWQCPKCKAPIYGLNEAHRKLIYEKHLAYHEAKHGYLNTRSEW